MWRILLLLIAFCGPALAAQRPDTRLTDNSDWWSFVRLDSYEIKVKPRDTELDKKNFSIAGSPLGDSFETLMAKFGKTSIIERGDAASGRHQICYESKQNAKQYLIFEFGEVEQTFFLLEGGQSWNGQELCTKTSSRRWITPSGLKLGIDRSKVEKILGKPDAVDGDRIVYLRQTKHKLSAQEFAEARRKSPNLNDQEAYEQLGFFDLTTYIDVRFSNSKLIYLAVSKTETN